MSMQLSPNAQKAMVHVDLLENEEVQHCFQADGLFVGTTPLAKLIGIINSFMATLTGGHIRMFLVVTNIRLILVSSQQVWCGCPASKASNVVALADVMEAGLSKESKLCCVHTRLIHVETKTQKHTFVVKSFNDDDLKNYLSVMSNLIVHNN